MNVKVLDCTLRDGGYANNWDFGYDNILGIINKLEKTNIEIIELGFIRDEVYDKNRSVYSATEQIASLIKNKKSNVKYSALIEMANYFPIEKLEVHKENTVDLIRYSFWKRLLDDGYEYCKNVAEKGYELSVQPTRVEQYTLDDFKYMVQKFGELKPYAIYIVDTFGLLSKKQLLQYAEIADKYMDKNIALGYHAHNNMQQAFSNAVSLLEQKPDRDVLIDASVFGMGRGAGNLNLECIANHLNIEYEKKYNVSQVYEIFDKYLKYDYEKYGWGYSMAYNIAASFECNPNYATYYRSEKKLDNNDIYNIISNICGPDKYLYSKDKAENFYNNYIESKGKNNE